MHRCAKCEGLSELSTHMTSGGVCYILCESCFEQVKDCPTGSLETFMAPKKESWVAKNMREARERRALGKFLWQ